MNKLIEKVFNKEMGKNVLKVLALGVAGLVEEKCKEFFEKKEEEKEAREFEKKVENAINRIAEKKSEEGNNDEV